MVGNQMTIFSMHGCLHIIADDYSLFCAPRVFVAVTRLGLKKSCSCCDRGWIEFIVEPPICN